MSLSAPQQATLEAFCRRMVPLPPAPDPAAAELARAVEARLAETDPDKLRLVATLLAVLDSPVTALCTGRASRFTRMAPAAQDAWLRGWEASAVPARRTIFQALRKLVLSTHYARPESFAHAGYLGPFHTRQPAHPWEGPLPGETSDSEPVARAASNSTAALPVVPGQLDLLSDPMVRNLVEGARLPAETRIKADVCVIGTGAGGAVAAARLAEAGHDVVLLEEGGYYRGEDFTEEEGPMMARLFADAGARATDDLAVSIFQGRTVGGSTTVNWMIMFRTPEWVLDEWETEHGTVGMSARDLAPVFARVEEETHTRPVPDDAHSPANRILLDGARALGWSASGGRINARGCVRSGFCITGCRYDAKQGTAATYVPAALAAGARLYTDVRAERIELLERGGKAPVKRVAGTVLDRATGKPRGRITVDAPVVVVAGGAVGTPALLQRSGMGGGAVGRFLRLHPTTSINGLYDRPVYQAGGIPLTTCCDEFLRSGPGGYGFWIETPPIHPALGSAALPGFGEEHRELMRQLPHTAGLIVLVRDGAEKARSNGEVATDRRGRLHLRYRMGRAERETALKGIEAAARMHFAAGAREVVTLHSPLLRLRSAADLGLVARRGAAANRLGLFSAHVNGTCRMGSDPRTSGCSPDGERWGVPGLYVADGSLLPTAPGINPQETIMALASVIAGRIAERHPAGRAGSAGALAGVG